nr:MAG TPA: hypothetical protein [Caudoviricetes sp.]
MRMIIITPHRDMWCFCLCVFCFSDPNYLFRSIYVGMVKTRR